jgi:hypothetical protein
MTDIFFDIKTSEDGELISIGLLAITNINKWQLDSETETEIKYKQYPYDEEYCDKYIFNKEKSNPEKIQSILYEKRNGRYVQGFREKQICYLENQEYKGKEKCVAFNGEYLHSNKSHLYNCSDSVNEPIFKMKDTKQNIIMYLKQWLLQFTEFQFCFNSTLKKEMLFKLLENNFYNTVNLEIKYKEKEIIDKISFAFEVYYHKEYEDKLEGWVDYVNDLGKYISKNFTVLNGNTLYEPFLDYYCYYKLMYEKIR